MKTTTGWLCGSFALAAILALPLSILADEHENGQARNDEAAEEQREEQETRKLSIIELEHRSPSEIRRILALGTEAAPQRLGFRPTPDGQDLHIATDEERRLLFVRGTEQEVQKIEELVDVYDRPADQVEKHQYNDMYLLPIDAEAAEDTRSLLAQLRYPDELISIGDVQLLVVRGDDREDAEEQVNQIERILEKLGTTAEPAEEETAEPAEEEAEDAEEPEEETDEEEGEPEEDED